MISLYPIAWLAVRESDGPSSSRCDLVHETGVAHGREPFCDARVQHIAGHPDADHPHRERGRAELVEPRPERRERLPREADHFERPDDPAGVVRVDLLGCAWVPSLAAPRTRPPRRPAPPSPPRARPADPGPRPGSADRRRPLARTGPSRPRGARAGRAPRSRRPRHAPRSGDASPTTLRWARPRRSHGAAPRRVRRPSAWRSRRRARGTPAWSRATRSRRHRARARHRERAPTSPMRSVRRERGA